MREVLNAVFYILGTGCQWRALPKDLPPRSTVHDYFVCWQCDGTLRRLYHALYEQAREMVGKEASPTTAIVDSQSVKGAERGGRPIDPVGYDAAKKVKGRKRHAVVDTLGLMLGCAILPGNVQDRDGCLGVLKAVRQLFPFRPCRKLWRGPQDGRARPRFYTLLTCGRPKQSASSRFCSRTVHAPAKPKPLRSHSIASKPWMVRRAVWKAWKQPTRGMGRLTRKRSLSIPCWRCLVT